MVSTTKSRIVIFLILLNFLFTISLVETNHGSDNISKNNDINLRGSSIIDSLKSRSVLIRKDLLVDITKSKVSDQEQYNGKKRHAGHVLHEMDKRGEHDKGKDHGK
ncbi:12089_t:CDS:1, partial [Funneliformis geosporum]